jgi:hypothetical protein
MRNFMLAVSVIAVGFLASRPVDSHASAADAVTIRVSSMQPDQPVQFSARYFGGGNQTSGQKDSVTAPFDVVIPGDEAYALFRQTGGSGTMRVEVSTKYGRGMTGNPIAMIVVTHDKLGVTGFNR